MMPKILLVYCLLAGLLAAGCVDDPPSRGDEDEKTVSLSLEDFMECDLQYPDNETKLSCEGGFDEVEAAATDRPSMSNDPGSICIYQPADSLLVTVSIYWDPMEDQYVLYYDAPQMNESVNGIFYTRSGEVADGEIQLAWYDGPKQGMIPLPSLQLEYDEQKNFVLRFYTHSLGSDSPGLQNGTIRAQWSLFEGRPYPLQVIETGERSYYFNEVDDTEHVTHPWDIRPFTLEGKDFNITVEADHHLNIRSAFNHLVDHQCTV